MPLDRRLTVTYEGPGGYRNTQQEYVPGPTITRGIWATRRDLSSQDVIDVGGSRTEVRRDWQIRWDKQISEIREDGLLVSLKVIDKGKSFNVENVIEESGRDGDFRRRWLRIQGVFTT